MAEQKTHLPSSVERVDVVVDRELTHEVVMEKSSAKPELVRKPEDDLVAGTSQAIPSELPPAGGVSALIPPVFGALCARDLNQTDHLMAEYDGRVKLITNVASFSDKTDTNYDELMQIYDRLLPEGFEVLAFACQQFKGQEYSAPEEIMDFISNYNVSFPVFDLTSVNGPNTHPIFLYCKWHSQELYANGHLQDIEGNFGKFLLDRNNRVYKYYKPDVKPLQMSGDIRKLLDGEVTGRERGPDGVYRDPPPHSGDKTH